MAWADTPKNEIAIPCSLVLCDQKRVAVGVNVLQMLKRVKEGWSDIHGCRAQDRNF